MPVVKATAGGGAHIEAGMYNVRCVETKLDHITGGEYGSGDVVRVIVEVDGEVDDDGNPIELDAIANLKLTPKSKLWEWAIAFGLTPVLGQDFDTDDLVDRRAQAVVVDKSKDGVTFSRIDKLMAASRRGGTAQPASVIKSDGTADWTVFWGEAKKLGFPDKAAIANFRGPEATPPINQLDGPDAQELLDKLRAAKVDPEAMPFE